MQIPKPILDRIEWDNNTDVPENCRIKSLKPCTEVCPDCGKTVTDRRIIKKLYERPYTHWRTKCFSCKRVKHPETGEFYLTDAGAYSFFKQWNKKQSQNQ